MAQEYFQVVLEEGQKLEELRRNRSARMLEVVNAKYGSSYPTLLKAILRAEIAIFHAQLQTRWALKGTCIFLAVNSNTLALFRDFR